MRSAWFALLCTVPALAGVAGVSAAGSPPLNATELRCEYRENPLGIDETAPRLSWQLKGLGRARMQSSYRILVATSTDRLKEGSADLWDSGKVSSDQNALITYSGKPLGSGQRAYWKVRAWDEAGREGPYSRPGWWEMGLLSPAEWSAQWIGLPASREESRLSLDGAHWVWYPEGNPREGAPIGVRYFRKTLALPAGRKVARATFLLAADNNYTLWVNGKEIVSGGGWQGAAQADVLPALTSGENTFAVSAENVGDAANPAGLVGRLIVSFESGDPLTLDIDRTWKVQNQNQSGWERGAFNDSAWKTPMVVANMGDGPWGKTSVANTGAMPSPFLYRRFDAPRSPITRARIYATALGLFQLYLNDERVSDDVLVPGWTDYRKRVEYRTYDVTSLIRPGRGTNAVGAILGDGWYAGSLGFDLSRNHFGPNPPRLKLKLVIEYANGGRDVIATDEKWEGRFGPILGSDLYGGETYDAREGLEGLTIPLFPHSVNQSVSKRMMGLGLLKAVAPIDDPNPRPVSRPVTVFTDQNPAVVAQVDPPIRVTEELNTQLITEPRPGTFIFDLGQNMVGFARLKVRGAKEGDRITMRFAEVLNPDGTVYRDNLRMAKATDEYICEGGREETWEPHFTYHGFRYVEVTGYPGKPRPDAITGRVFHSSMTPTSRFETSSTLVNRLYHNIWWGTRSNLMSVCTDCPQRDERLGWMGDAQLFARSACWYMDMAPFYTKWIRDIVDAQSPAGGFSDVSPRTVDMADGAPAWAEAGVVIPWTVYQCYGDKRILERYYPAIKKYVDLIHSANPNLLWLKRRNNDFGDWVPAGENTNKDVIACAYFAYDARLLSEMAAALGKTDDARAYGELADKIRDAFNERFLAADGKYLGDTQTAYAMAFAFDLVPPARRAQVSDRLRESVARRGFKLGTGFIGTGLLLPALSETNQSDLAYRLLTNTKYPSWGYMIEHGATTVWELWNSDTEGPGMNSRNHFAFGSVAEWMQRYLAGIELDPSAPGYKKIVIRPRVGGSLAFAKAEYDSPQGTIVSGWTRNDRGVTLRVTIPANTTATVYVPKQGRNPSVTEGGEPVWRGGAYVPGVPGVKAAHGEGDWVVLEVGSGAFELTAAS